MSNTRRQLVVQAHGAEDAARKRVAQELHDDILQNLLAAQRAMTRHERGDRSALAQAKEALSLAVSRLRRQVFELHPPALAHSRLGEAVRQVAEQQASLAGWAVHLDIDDRTDASQRQVLFSLARELLTNAARHSDASNVWLTLERKPSELMLEVRDDGVGFMPERVGHAILDGHIGLASSRERVEGLGGRFEVHSTPGNGTLVRIRLPARPSGRLTQP